MLRHIYILTFILCLLSCRHEIYIQHIDRAKFCQYFNLQISKHFSNGRSYISTSTQIQNVANDQVSEFVKKHNLRFDYIISKTFSSILHKEKTMDSAFLADKFCSFLSSDTFYNQFNRLTNADRDRTPKEGLRFTTSEMMRVASRFFMCDQISEKDTSIGYHICVGINGISEMLVLRDYTVLEAFCFEAIFKNLRKRSKFLRNFNAYISRASRQCKERFTNFKTYLNCVKNLCYEYMEKDDDLKVTLLEYYKKNLNNLHFEIN